MRLRTMKLQQYGISNKKYKELCGFCEQYPEWKRELSLPPESVKSSVITGMPKVHGVNGSSTESNAVRRVMLSEKVKMIEETAKAASPEFYESIIKSACYEVPFYALKNLDDIAISERSFSDIRRFFFYLLSQKR